VRYTFDRRQVSMSFRVFSIFPLYDNEVDQFEWARNNDNDGA